MSGVDETIRYSIDQNDVIISLSTNWQSYANSNAGGEACLPENIIGNSIYKYIADFETEHFYQIMIHKIRAGGKSITFPFRCDSPSQRRKLQMRIIQIENSVVFECEVEEIEERVSVDLLRSDLPRTNDMLKVCSMCKQIELTSVEWAEVETALEALGLFDQKQPPQLTHGLCPDCHKIALDELNNL